LRSATTRGCASARSALRHGPLAAVFLVELADHARHALAGADPAKQLLLELVLDELALFLDHQDLFQPLGKAADRLRLQRPDHAALEQAQPDARAGGLVQSEVGQRLARVEVGLAAGDDAKARVGRVHHRVVELVGAAVGERGVQLVVQQARLLLQRRVRPADVQSAGGHLEVRRQHDVHALGVDDHRGARLHHLGHRLDADPHARVAAHGEAVQAEVEVLLHRGRVQHRHHAGLEDVVALVRQR